MKRVILYTKPGCHLCGPVRRTILEVQGDHPFAFEERNILDDPSDFQSFKDEIPVVSVDGRVISRYRLSREELEAALGGG